MSVPYYVAQGDSIPSIAKATGFFWKTLWNHGDNADLKSKRKNPNVLYEGDIVFIPELETKTESRPSDKTHKFHRKGEPIKIALKFLKSDGTPRANEPYTLKVGVKEFKGNTDGNGVIRQKVPNDAREGVLKFKDGKETVNIAIGCLDPVDVIVGVQQRLKNLGFDCEPTNEEDDATTRAVTNFQAEQKLNVTGEIDEATKSKLQELSQ